MRKKYDELATRDYYDSFGEVYEAVWNEQIHTGLFDKDKPLDQAVSDMNLYLAIDAQIKPNFTVMTLGCGRGGADRFLAKEKMVKIIGLDISSKQLAAAISNARAEGLLDRIEYV